MPQGLFDVEIQTFETSAADKVPSWPARQRQGTKRSCRPTLRDKAKLNEEEGPVELSESTQKRIRLYSLLVIIGCIVYVIIDIIVQMLPPHYSPVRQAESDLAVGPYGILMNINFMVRGVLSFLMVLALSRVFPKSATGATRERVIRSCIGRP